MTNTCSGCDATWTGSRIAHCSAAGCHASFSTVANFDKHRRDFACLDPAAVGLVLTDGLWRARLTDAARSRLAALGVRPQTAEQGGVAQSPQPCPDEALSATEAAS